MAAMRSNPISVLPRVTSETRSTAASMSGFLPFTRPEIDQATIDGVTEVLRSGWITTGLQNQRFETALSERFGGRPTRTFNSGTATLEIALRIAGIGAGDEVITTPLTWVATANVILAVGATPVFVDIDRRTRNMDLERVEAAITPRTRALMPVHLAGLPVDMDRLNAIAARYGLRVIEDAAQAFGASWNGREIGSFGDLVSFSFHANKNLTSIEGGALVFNNEEEARLAERYRLHGVTRFGIDGMDVDLLGGKFNLSDVAARVGLGQLPHIDRFNAQRRMLARCYLDLLTNGPACEAGVELPPADFSNTNWHMFQIVLPPATRGRPDRASFMTALKALQIGTGAHYPPIHLFSLYRQMGFKAGMFPEAEHVGAHTVSLPMFSALTPEDVARVVAAVDTQYPALFGPNHAEL